MSLFRKAKEGHNTTGSGVGTSFIEIFPHRDGYSRVEKKQSTFTELPDEANEQSEFQDISSNSQSNELNLPKTESSMRGKIQYYYDWYNDKPKDIRAQITYLVAIALVFASFIQGLVIKEGKKHRIKRPAVAGEQIDSQSSKRERLKLRSTPASLANRIPPRNRTVKGPPPARQRRSRSQVATPPPPQQQSARAQVETPPPPPERMELRVPAHGLPPIPEEILKELGEEERRELLQAMEDMKNIEPPIANEELGSP